MAATPAVALSLCSSASGPALSNLVGAVMVWSWASWKMTGTQSWPPHTRLVGETQTKETSGRRSVLSLLTSCLNTKH